MNYDDFTEIRRGRLLGLERLEDRIRHAMLSTSIPDLSADEVAILLNGSYLKKPESKKDPKEIVIDWCKAEINRKLEEWSFERYYFQNDPDTCPSASPPDTSLQTVLIGKVHSWTMLEALKVIRIFEEIDALSLTALRLTPESVHRLLEDTRAKPA